MYMLQNFPSILKRHFTAPAEIWMLKIATKHAVTAQS